MHPQDDLLVIEALVEYSRTRRDHAPDRSERAYAIADTMAAEHGLGLEDAIRQIE
ncbi:hypothetical protein ACFQO4_19445 [Saliphagus sp. GCM10025334]|uniref:hypothetical protein n=1 Tax=Natronosalvus caseinilyticus TaxID=2953747 RepID=UPI0028AEC122|nr:hypothetical protein [Natronosalvus caseinilyticus]